MCQPIIPRPLMSSLICTPLVEQNETYGPVLLLDHWMQSAKESEQNFIRPNVTMRANFSSVKKEFKYFHWPRGNRQKRSR